MSAWPRSKVFLQIHARVHRGHLRFIAIEHQRFSALGKDAIFTQPSLSGLTPSGMVHIGVHIGVKTILVGSGLVPSGGRLFVRELDLDN